MQNVTKAAGHVINCLSQKTYSRQREDEDQEKKEATQT